MMTSHGSFVVLIAEATLEELSLQRTTATNHVLFQYEVRFVFYAMQLCWAWSSKGMESPVLIATKFVLKKDEIIVEARLDTW